MLKLLVPLLQFVPKFLPNLLGAYKAKPLTSTSEWYVAVLTGLGALGVHLGYVDQATFDNVLYPALVYVLARVLGKGAAEPAGV